MNINKGYILPVILILALLTLAGFIVFTQQVVESPVVEQKKMIIPEDIKIPDSIKDPLTSTSTENYDNEEIATTSATTTASSSDIQIE